MSRKSQPVVVIWGGLMFAAIIIIGVAAYFMRPEPTAQMPGQASAAYFMRPWQRGQMQNQPSVSPGAVANTDAQLADEANKITVSIYDGRSGPGQWQFLGSGIIVTGQEVLTNAHIVNNRTNLFVYVFAPQPVTYPVVLSRCDSVNDLALLKVSNSSTFSSIGLLGNPEDVVVGDSVFAMGNAFGNGNLLLGGVIMDKNFQHPVNGQLITSMRTNISISPGTCGGPLVNAKGEVIGISNSENDYFVTPITRALSLIYKTPQNQVASDASAQFA